MAKVIKVFKDVFILLQDIWSFQGEFHDFSNSIGSSESYWEFKGLSMTLVEVFLEVFKNDFMIVVVVKTLVKVIGGFKDVFMNWHSSVFS